MEPEVSHCIHKSLQYPTGYISDKFNKKNRHMHPWDNIVFMYDVH